MKNIEIDDQVYDALAAQARGFDTPNAVLRRLFHLEPNGSPALSESVASSAASSKVVEFLQSDQFKQLRQGIDRYLAILAFAYKQEPKEFQQLENYGRGRRVYFAKSRKAIEDSGKGVTAAQVPGSPYWTLTTLDNRAKRSHLQEVLQRLGYRRDEITEALRALPDSGIRRSRVNLLEYA